MTPAPRTPGQASDAAVEAAARTIQPEMKWPGTARGQARAYLAAAHDTALGDQRSVCLADVLAFLREWEIDQDPRPAFVAIAHEFGGRDE